MVVTQYDLVSVVKLEDGDLIGKILDIVPRLPDPSQDFMLEGSAGKLNLVPLFWKRAGQGLKRSWEWNAPERYVDKILRKGKLLEIVQQVIGPVSPYQLESCPLQINRYSESHGLSWHEHATVNEHRNIRYVMVVPLFDEDPEAGDCLRFRNAKGLEFNVPTRVGTIVLFPASLLHRADVNRSRIVVNVNIP